MVVGLCTVEIYIPTSHSLKDKRGIVKGVVQRLRSKFNVSVCELDNHDVWKTATLGLASVSKDKDVIDRTFGAIEGFLDNNGYFQVVSFKLEII
jgi:uncharacterized protein YlxP (DUF503 family)